MKIQGIHGSSGLNADDWRNLDCLRNSPAEIRITIASLVMKISIIELDRKFVVPSIACRHIPIGKNTEVLPFGVDRFREESLEEQSMSVSNRIQLLWAVILSYN